MLSGWIRESVIFPINMRFWIFILFFLVLSLALVQAYRLTPLANEYFPKEFSRRTLTFTGNYLIPEEKLLSRLPAVTNLSWYFTPDQIEKALEQESLVAKAHVRTCTQWSVDCYQIHITEYRPDFLYKVSNKSWLITKDGDFLLPISQENAGKYFAHLPQLEDLLFAGKNNEFLGTRLRYLIAQNNLLVGEGIMPVSLQLQASNELKLQLKDNPGEIFLSNADLNAEKFRTDIISLKNFFKAHKAPEAPHWTLDLRPKHPVLKVPVVAPVKS